MTLSVDVAEPTANSAVTIAQFEAYLAQRFPAGCALCDATSAVQEAHLLNAMTLLKSFDWKGVQPKRRGILFESTTVSIASNVITFDDIESLISLDVSVYELAGFPEYVNRSTARVFQTTPHWIKLKGCANSENDTFFYPYSIDVNTITIDPMYGKATDEAATANVTVYIEEYVHGAELGYSDPLPFPRRGKFINNELPSVIPGVIEVAQMELAISDYSSSLIKTGNAALVNSVSMLDLGGDLKIELDKSEFNNAVSPVEIQSPLPDMVLTLLRPYLRTIPGVISGSARTSKIMRV